MARFTQYRTFVAVVDTGSLSAAARALNITPSAVSKQLGLLEETVRVRLVERSNRSVTPTSAGGLFYQRCKEILNSVSQAEEMLKTTNRAVSGRLSVTLSKSLARSQLFDVFAEFSDRYPDVLFDVRLTDQVEDLHEHDIDFAFRLGRVNDSSRLYSTPLAATKLICCCTPKYLERYGRPSTLGELKNHKVILLMPKNLSEQLRQFFKQEKVILDRHNSPITNDVEAVYQAVRSGMSMGMMLDVSIRSELAAGSFVDVLPDHGLPAKQLHLVSKEQELAPHKCSVFKQFVKEKFSIPNTLN